MSLQTNIVTSVFRSLEANQAHQVSPRVTGLNQEQLAAQAAFETLRKKVQSSDKAAESKVKKDKDPNQDAREHGHGGSSPSYGSSGQTENVGEETEGHVIDALA